MPDKKPTDMIHDIVRHICFFVRAHGLLSQDEVAEAVGRDRQICYRWEEVGQVPSSRQAKILFELGNCTPLVFAEIVCKYLSKLTGRRVIVAPEDQVGYLPTVPLARAAELYRTHYDILSPQQRTLIEDKLRMARTTDAAVDYMMSAIERDVQHEVDRATGKGQSGPA